MRNSSDRDGTVTQTVLRFCWDRSQDPSSHIGCPELRCTGAAYVGARHERCRGCATPAPLCPPGHGGRGGGGEGDWKQEEEGEEDEDEEEGEGNRTDSGHSPTVHEPLKHRRCNEWLTLMTNPTNRSNK